LRKQWKQIKEQLLAGKYQPQPVRRVEIAKPGGGTRMLGIPTVIDRLIQQATHQVMSPVWEVGFSESSHGFRPRRSAHGAVEAARAHVEAGHRWVTDLDLEKFFDLVNHDVLMARVARKISDPRVLGLIRRYLQSGVMAGGMVEQRVEGTPQGGPLSPLLSNILLDDLDKELERRRHRFCRYADDCNIYVKSRRAGERVLASVAAFLRDRLKLKVNASKSAVRRPWESKFLGYSMTVTRRPRLKVADQSVQRLRAKVRALLPRGRGKRMTEFITEDLNPLLRGWANYYRKAEVRGILEELDRWVRRKLRCILWRSWKRARTRARRLIAGGVAAEHAWHCVYNGRGPWHNAGSQAMNTAYPAAAFARMGLVSLTAIIIQPRA
jgi:RNA-directed DNA polymerase